MKPIKTLLMTGIILCLCACNLPKPVKEATLPPEFARLTLAATLFPVTPKAEEQTLAATPEPAIIMPTENAQPLPVLDTPQPLMLLNDDYFRYTIKSGETLPALAARFDVLPEEILATRLLSATGFLPVGLEVAIPNTFTHHAPYTDVLLPDSEILYSAAAADFDVALEVRNAGGYLNQHKEYVSNIMLGGAEIVHLVAIETSTNPRLLLAFLEYRSGWVFSNPPGAVSNKYPLGFQSADAGLYKELMIAARLLAQGYYGWRDGSFEKLTFADRTAVYAAPAVNAGTVALQNLFAPLYGQDAWFEALYGAGGFITFFIQHYGDPWVRAASAEPIFADGVQPPELALPFRPGMRWSLTAGPHVSWQTGTPRGALDFAPPLDAKGCTTSYAWVTASAAGLVVRADRGVVALDLDGDGNEGTGWVIIYMHIATSERAKVGDFLALDDNIGHPSCEGGRATGTHFHVAHKLNGEWLALDAALPVKLSGWQAIRGEGAYEGAIMRDGVTITALPYGSVANSLFRDQ